MTTARMAAHHILVVDDEPDIRSLVQDILADEGYQVESAPGAAAARAALRAKRPDLVLLDVWMPDTELPHALRDSKSARAATLPDEAWRNLPELLRQAKPYLDTLDHALVYEIDLGERAGKVVIRVNYNEKGRFDGVRARIVSNFVQTGGLVQRQNLQADMRYQRLE